MCKQTTNQKMHRNNTVFSTPHDTWINLKPNETILTQFYNFFVTPHLRTYFYSNKRNSSMLTKVFIIILILNKTRTENSTNKTLTTQKIENLLPKINETPLINFLTTILQRFKDFDRIFHFKNSYEINFMKNFSQNSNQKGKTYWATSVQNHNFASKFVRPETFKVVHVIFDLNEDMASIARPKKVKSTDVVIFVSKKDIKDKILSYGEGFIKISGRTLLVQKEEGSIKIFEVCYFCRAKSKKFIELPNLNEIKDEDIFPSNFTDLNGHFFKICFITYFPIVYCEENITRSDFVPANKFLSNVECVKISGVEGKLLEIVSKSLNFTFRIFFMDPDAGWFNMIELVNKSEVDFAIGGISLTEERIPMVQFTNVFNYENYNLLYLFNLKFGEIFDNFMSPFKALFIWSLYFVSYLVFSLILYLSWKIKIRKKKLELSFTGSVWNLFMVITEQSNPYIVRLYQNRTSCGLILTCWWYCSLIFSTMYKSTVLSATAYPPNLEPQDLDDLLEVGYKLVTNQQSADVIKQIFDTQNKVYKNIKSKIIYGKDVCDVFNKILPGHVAMLDEQNTIQYEVLSRCKPKDSQITLLRICKKPAEKTGHAWATQLSAPYTPSINRIISHIIEAGILEQLIKESIQGFEKNQIHFAREKKTGGVEALSLKRILPLFLIYAIGITISVITFIIELILQRCKMKIKYNYFE